MFEKFLAFVFFCLALSSASLGQTIGGKVLDKNNTPLEFVTITLKSDSTHVFSFVSKKDGRFTFENLKSQTKYLLNFTLIGYAPIDTVIFSSSLKDAVIILTAQKTLLREVTVKARKNLIERKIDRLVFNVADNINAIGSDGLDILSKTPMVRVDGNSVSLIGKDGVEIMIDGRLTHLSGDALASLLKSISATNIAKIEVITNPPAQYDAAGNSGLINIVTKRERQLGYFGKVSSTISKGTYAVFSNGLNVNYNFDKLLLFGSLNISRGASGPTFGLNRYYDIQTWEQSASSKESSHYLTGELGFEYLASKTTTVGASYSSFTSYPDLTGVSNTAVRENQGNVIDSILRVNYFNRKKFATTTANFHIDQKLGASGEDLTFDADYFNNTADIFYNSHNENFLSSGSPTSSPINYITSGSSLASNGFTLNSVVSLPLKKVSLTFGGKASFISSNSDVSFYNYLNNVSSLDSANSNRFKFNENTQALFGSLSTKWGKLAFQAGLRAEATQTKGVSVNLSETNTNSYLSLFPTTYLSYELNKKDQLTLSYGRRIGRPNFSAFNPIRIYSDQYSYYAGNPFLKPSYSNNFELSNTYNHFLTTTFSYGITSNAPTSLETVTNGSNIQATIFGNYLTVKHFLLDNVLTLQLFGWWENSTEFSINYSKTRSSSALIQPTTQGAGANFRTINSLYFNKTKTLMGGINFTYQFPNVSDFSHFRKYYFADLTCSYLFLRKKMQLTASARDIFKTKIISYYNVINDVGLLSTANNDSRRGAVTLKYTFGNTKMRKARSHDVSSSEESRSGN